MLRPVGRRVRSAGLNAARPRPAHPRPAPSVSTPARRRVYARLAQAGARTAMRTPHGLRWREAESFEFADCDDDDESRLRARAPPRRCPGAEWTRDGVSIHLPRALVRALALAAAAVALVVAGRSLASALAARRTPPAAGPLEREWLRATLRRVALRLGPLGRGGDLAADAAARLLEASSPEHARRALAHGLRADRVGVLVLVPREAQRRDEELALFVLHTALYLALRGMFAEFHVLQQDGGRAARRTILVNYGAIAAAAQNRTYFCVQGPDALPAARQNTYMHPGPMTIRALPAGGRASVLSGAFCADTRAFAAINGYPTAIDDLHAGTWRAAHHIDVALAHWDADAAAETWRAPSAPAAIYGDANCDAEHAADLLTPSCYSAYGGLHTTHAYVLRTSACPPHTLPLDLARVVVTNVTTLPCGAEGPVVY